MTHLPREDEQFVIISMTSSFFPKWIAGIIPMRVCVWLMNPLAPFSGKEETGDEEEADNGNVALRTINMFWAPRLYQCFSMSFVIKNWILYSLQFSLSILCATTLTKKKVLLSQKHGTKKSLNYVWL